MPTQLLDIYEAAELLHTTVPTMRLWQTKGYGPRGAVLGRRLMYRADDLEAWLQAQFESTAR